MAGEAEVLENVLDKLVKDVEMAVHAMYRGDTRQHTAKAKTDQHKRAAREALGPLMGVAPRVSVGAVVPQAGTLAGLSPDEVSAITRCVMAWLPMGAPSSAAPDSRCVAAGREMLPTWGERERARVAIKRASENAA